MAARQVGDCLTPRAAAIYGQFTKFIEQCPVSWSGNNVIIYHMTYIYDYRELAFRYRWMLEKLPYWSSNQFFVCFRQLSA